MEAVLDFIYNTQGPQQQILLHLHELISSYPNVAPKIKYKIPFYYANSWVCYLNPVKPNGVELAFTRGNELSNAQGLLDFKGRKQIAGMSFFAVKDISNEVVHEMLQEAFLLDETVPYASKRKGK